MLKTCHAFASTAARDAFGVGTETPIGKMCGVNLGSFNDAFDEASSQAPIIYIDGRNDRWQTAPEFFGHL